MVGGKILIADDNEELVDIFATTLSRDFDVRTAFNGREATQLYREERADVVLMDILMPVMDGIEATRHIKSMDPDAIIIGVTAYAENMGENLIRAGAVEVLKKPFSTELLKKTILKYIHR